MEPIILIPKNTSFQVPVTIPQKWVGTAVEIDIQVKPIAYESSSNGAAIKGSASDIFKDCSVNLSGFTFNRDEANEYN
jgi:hypothetical protein